MTGAGGDAKAGSTGAARPPARFLPAALALAAAAGGLALVRAGEPSWVAAGVLLLVAALALAAVAIGGAAEGGEAAAGRLDLGSRLGLGLLGGFLGAVAALVAQGLLGPLGLPGWLGVELPGVVETGGAAVRLLQGALWGLLFGVVLPWAPGGGTLGRGAAFSLLPSLAVLLVAFPADAASGWLGLERGALTPAFVLLLNGVWGITLAAVMAWGERTGTSLSSPLGA